MSKVIQTVEELDAVLHWRGKHAVAIKERDALQQRLTAADERADVLEGLLREACQHHGVMLMSDPPQAAWKYHRMNERIDAALKPATAGDCHHGYTSILECPECGAPYQ